MPVLTSRNSVAPDLAANAGSSEPECPAPLALHGLRVLVVDDEADAREVLHAFLVQAGAEVATAASVSEAFDALTRFRPHVIISDIGMPDENGYSFIRNLRQVMPEDGGATSALALTGYLGHEDRMKALAAGFTQHIGKPANPDELLAAILNVAPSVPR